jgi:hypothetical protein
LTHCILAPLQAAAKGLNLVLVVLMVLGLLMLNLRGDGISGSIKQLWTRREKK